MPVDGVAPVSGSGSLSKVELLTCWQQCHVHSAGEHSVICSKRSKSLFLSSQSFFPLPSICYSSAALKQSRSSAQKCTCAEEQEAMHKAFFSFTHISK